MVDGETSAVAVSIEQMSQPGYVVWHSSEEDGGPDVGITVGLGDGKMLWVGERSGREGDGMGLLVYGPDKIVENASLGEFDEIRNLIEFHVAPALSRVTSTPQAASAIPDGCRIVPIEPTEEMCEAGWPHLPELADAWRAMVAASGDYDAGHSQIVSLPSQSESLQAASGRYSDAQQANPALVTAPSGAPQAASAEVRERISNAILVADTSNKVWRGALLDAVLAILAAVPSHAPNGNEGETERGPMGWDMRAPAAAPSGNADADMKPWSGGESPPDDLGLDADGNMTVQWRHGSVWTGRPVEVDWEHRTDDHPFSHDIIAYTPKVQS